MVAVLLLEVVVVVVVLVVVVLVESRRRMSLDTDGKVENHACALLLLVSFLPLFKNHWLLIKMG